MKSYQIRYAFDYYNLIYPLKKNPEKLKHVIKTKNAIWKLRCHLRVQIVYA